MKITNYQHWWDKIWIVITILTGGVKYEQFQLSIVGG